ncbi:Hypothetical protein, putative [Bodo saltans]|uniref:Uncharacterized protein n=1 Tax=Bodo saltans TaxID=75058 RepID=A0A0S4ITF2_BODSA|nr:Hypothetical protein, putative [Bodo saltans]|eukprot:CUF81960.1 Hypothetical protein, putative [Bodo saltans]
MSYLDSMPENSESERPSRRPQLKLFIVDADSIAHTRSSSNNNDDDLVNPLNGSSRVKLGQRKMAAVTAATSSPSTSSFFVTSPTTSSSVSSSASVTSSNVSDDEEDIVDPSVRSSRIDASSQSVAHIIAEQALSVALEQHSQQQQERKDASDSLLLSPLLFCDDFKQPPPLASLMGPHPPAATLIGFREDLNEAEQRFRFTMDKQRERSHAQQDATYDIHCTSQQHGAVFLKMLVVEAFKQNPRKVSRDETRELIRSLDDKFTQHRGNPLHDFDDDHSYSSSPSYLYQEAVSLLATQQLFRRP